MPVNTRAARPTASEGREPLASDNDFTVLFQRSRVSARSASPPRILPPEPPPKPPVAPEPPAPRSMAVSPAPPTQTVTVRPTSRVLLARAAVLLALGGTLGVGVEWMARGRALESWGEPGESSATSALTGALSNKDPVETESEATAAPVSGTVPRLLREAHHRRVHHSVVTASTAPAATVDGGDDGGDDIAAARETLTKAKEEVTIP